MQGYRDWSNRFSNNKACRGLFSIVDSHGFESILRGAMEVECKPSSKHLVDEIKNKDDLLTLRSCARTFISGATMSIIQSLLVLERLAGADRTVGGAATVAQRARAAEEAGSSEAEEARTVAGGRRSAGGGAGWEAGRQAQAQGAGSGCWEDDDSAQACWGLGRWSSPSPPHRATGRSAGLAKGRFLPYNLRISETVRNIDRAR